ncbi:MAG: carboxypeptidase regulatory-like domain-containing protein, partial [Opitutales bacterium]
MKQIIARTIIITMAVVPLLLLPSIRAMQFEIPDSKESGAESEQEPESDENVTTKDASRPDADEQEEAGSEEEQRAVSNGSTEEDDIEESDAATGGRIEGRVVDRETGAPLSGVAVVVEDTDFGTITNNEGNYTIEGVPEGEYKLSFVKSGYIESNVTDVGVEAEETEVLDFGLPPRPAEMSDEVYDLQDFTVTSEEASEMMVNLDIRMESDSIIDMLSSEDLSRFADSDVGSAVKRVAGVSVQDGKFAVIRGLEERYSSTLFNGVPVPSPDPERQSVPLDLFPSEIVKNLSVTKTFEVDQPSNSAGGTINIRSDVYPEELTIKGTVGGGINENSQDVFLEPSQSRESIDFDNIEDVDARALQGFGGAPVERSGSDTIEHDFDIEIGDTREVFGKTVRYLGSLAFDKDFDTKLGIEHPRKARPSDVADGEIQNLGFSKPRFDVTESASEEQLTGLFSTELDLDDEANHTVGYTGFFTRTEEEFAALRDNG